VSTDLAGSVLPLSLGLLGAFCSVVLIAKWPGRALTVLVPVLMWPQLLRVGPLPLQRVITLLLVVGLLIGARRAKAPRWLVPGVIALSVLLIASLYLHVESVFTLPSEARNSMLALLLNLWLVVALAKARPEPATVFRAVGLGSIAFAVYVVAFGQSLGGRVDLEGLNPNSAGHAAALGVAALAATAMVTGHRRWLLAAVAPLSLVYLAQSRGAVVVLIAGAATAWVLSHSGAKRAAAVLLGAAATGLLWGPAAHFTQDNLLAERSAEFVSTDARTRLLQVAGRLIVEHPVFGIGYARFPDYSQPAVGLALNTHNEWIRIAVEVGLPAVLLLLFVVGSPLARRLAQQGPVPLPAGRAAKAVLAAGCVSWMFSNVMTDLRVALPVWAAAAMAWSLVAHPEAKQASAAHGAQVPGSDSALATDWLHDQPERAQ